jgi:hypothetical protein
MRILKKSSGKQKFYMVSSGQWSVVVSAKSKSSALKDIFNDMKNNPDNYTGIGEVVCVMDIDKSMKDLTLQDSLKFTSVSDFLEIISKEKTEDGE